MKIFNLLFFTVSLIALGAVPAYTAGTAPLIQGRELASGAAVYNLGFNPVNALTIGTPQSSYVPATGLGSAANYEIGTSGSMLCLLSSVCQYSTGISLGQSTNLGFLTIPTYAGGTNYQTTFQGIPAYNEELVLQSNNPDNSLAIQNNNVSGFSAIALRSSTGWEQGAIGYGNTSAGAGVTGAVYIETSGFQAGIGGPTVPGPANAFFLNQTGTYVSNGYANYHRIEITPDSQATINLYSVQSNTVTGKRFSLWGDTGLIGIGKNVYNDKNDASAPLNIIDPSALQFRMVKYGLRKVDFVIDTSGSPFRGCFQDTDAGGTIYPFCARLDGSGMITTNGTQLSSVTVAGLPPCNPGNDGALMYVSNALSPTWNAVIVGGGTSKVLALCVGSEPNWHVH